MKFLVVFVVLFASGNAWFWNSDDKASYSSLYVTFGSFNKLPTTESDAKSAGWTRTKACDASNFFAGHRYVLNGDTATMLLFGANGQVAGIQMGIPKSALKTNQGPWVLEGNMYVMTAYFTDPSTICSNTQTKSSYGDRLLIWDGSTNKALQIPYKQEDLAGSKWVAGKCFPMMGNHYWYSISQGMNCDDFYPVFLMYNGKKLNGFGWNTYGDLKSSRYEHPTPDKLGYFFQSASKPQCLATAGPLTTQHIYMDWPYNNLCYVGKK